MKMTNNLGFPDAVVRAVEHNVYDLDKSDLSRIGVTTLIDAPIQRLLKARHASEIVEDVADAAWVLLGNAAHQVACNSAGDGDITEQRIEKAVYSKTLSGQPDNYNPNTGVICDWKVTSAWKLIFSDGGCPEEWEKQLNCYAYLIRTDRHGQATDPVKELKLIVVIRDWDKHSVGRQGYPEHPIQVVTAPLWTYEKQCKFVEERMELHVRDEQVSTELLSPCSEKERWAKPNTYAVTKKGNVRAVRVYNTKAEADAHVAAEPSKGLIVEIREGKDTRCEEYCLVSKWCPYHQSKFAIDLF